MVKTSGSSSSEAIKVDASNPKALEQVDSIERSLEQIQNSFNESNFGLF
jgi:hypothetical protein